MGFFRGVYFSDPGPGRASCIEPSSCSGRGFLDCAHGSQWRDLPEEFGKWSSVYRQFRRWTLAGLWELILGSLNDSGTAEPQVQMIDSTVIRAHHLAAGAKGGLTKTVLAVQKVASRQRYI